MTLLNKSITLQNKQITPPIFLAPMAGLTHSAFRRLLSDLGGYGALYTEMLSASALMVENISSSPFTRKREQEGKVIYQLKLSGNEPIDKIINRLNILNPFAIDINLGCPAPAVKKQGCGKSLFDNFEKLDRTLDTLRKCWSGILTVKCRLGNNHDDWQEQFAIRLRLFQNHGIDAICVHPRFSDEKLKRKARRDLFPWIKSLSDLPLIANGDICDKHDIDSLFSKGCDAIMIGRMAAVKPWIFRELCKKSISIDFIDIWNRHVDYICEDFPPEKAIGRIKEFTSYYARNFFFGHELFRAVQSAPDIDLLRKKANEFLGSNPQTTTVSL